MTKRMITSITIDPQPEPELPSTPTLPALPTLSIHYEDGGYFARLQSPGLYAHMPDFHADAYEAARTRDDFDASVLEGMTHFNLAAADVRNAKGDFLGRVITINAPAHTHDHLAQLVAYRLALHAGLNDKLPTDDVLFDRVMNQLSTHKRKMYRSKLSGVTYPGRDVMCQQLVHELHEEIAKLMTELLVPKPKRIFTPKPAPELSKALNQALKPLFKEPKMTKAAKKTPKTEPEPRVKLEGSITPSELADEFGMTPQRLRKFLRQLYAENEQLAHAHRQRWIWHPEHDEDELRIIREALTK